MEISPLACPLTLSIFQRIFRFRCPSTSSHSYLHFQAQSHMPELYIMDFCMDLLIE